MHASYLIECKWSTTNNEQDTAIIVTLLICCQHCAKQNLENSKKKGAGLKPPLTTLQIYVKKKKIPE